MTRNIQQLFDLKGKTALITGGSRGLGLQMAYALGEAGARVVISSRKASDLEEATAELQAAGIDARWIAADCQHEEDIRRLTSETLQRVGDVDILVNNAGAAWGAPAEDHPLEAWDKVMNLNVRSYFLLSQLIAKASMIPRRSGSIINTASIAGLGGNPSGMKTIAYNTSKGAVINFTRALAAEWGSAVCYSTHYLPEVEALEASVAILDEGRVIARGDPTQLIAGQAEAAIELRFDGEAPASVGGLECVRQGTVLVVSTPNPAGELPGVMAALGDDVARLESVELLRPNLESLFLALTGRRYDVEGIEVGEVVGAAEGVTSGSGPVPEKERP